MIGAVKNILKPFVKATHSKEIQNAIDEVTKVIEITFEAEEQDISSLIKEIKLGEQSKEVYPNLIGRLIGHPLYKKGILSLFTLKKGETFPRHRHPEPEALWVIDGEMKEIQSNQVLGKYDSMFIPSNQTHAVQALSDCTYFLVWEHKKPRRYT